MYNSYALLVDLYELTMAQCYFHYREDTWATFDLFVRDFPKNRSYLVAAGLDDILKYVLNLRFVDAELAYLKSLKLFTPDFLGYLKDFRFKGHLWALPEGEVFFPQETVIRVTAPIIQTQLIESVLLNTVNLQSMIASKASRIVLSAKSSNVYDFSLRRTHGPEAGLKVARSSYLAGFSGTSNVLAGKMYKIPVAGTMAHSFVMSFRHELDSFLAYAETFPKKTILLVDTYDTLKGIENAVTVGLFLKEKGHRLVGIRLDSGDFVSLSKIARHKLNQAGLGDVKIYASGDLDEFKIKVLLSKGACIDSFGVGTNMGASTDAPVLDVVYKLSEVTDEFGKFQPKMKISKGKATYPGRKQVYRIKDKRGRFVKDIIGLWDEAIKGKPLLKKVIHGGNLVYKAPALEQSRIYLKQNLKYFPVAMKEIDSDYRYPVLFSPGLEKLKKDLSKQLVRRQ
ncbi:MAG: nicotinate phosphoribosyltransferase [Candidatus Omnitrophica bacterium]|nr:nicotinate phosphoribosyltransferase [Candidatus Omnitrophota bacterium]